MAYPNKAQWVESLVRLVVRRARAIIADENTWERHCFALDHDGRDVPVTSPDAARFCAQAALTKTAYDIVGTSIPALDYRKLARLAGDCIVGYQDLGQINANRGRRRVLKLIDEFLDQEKPASGPTAQPTPSKRPSASSPPSLPAGKQARTLTTPKRTLPPFDAFRNYRFGHGLAVALLGLVAISYSLPAKLSLWARVGSDRLAKRAATSNVAMNVRDEYQRAKFKLDGLPAARSVAERRTQCAWAHSYRLGANPPVNAFALSLSPNLFQQLVSTRHAVQQQPA